MLMREVALNKHRMELVASLAMNRSVAAFEGMKKVYLESEDEELKTWPNSFL